MTMYGSRARPALRGAAARKHRPVVRAAALLLTFGLGACDFPTGLPVFESRFVVPLDERAVSVSQLLPAGITATPTAFQVTLGPSATQRTVGQMCGAPCQSLQGQQAPKPAFTDVIVTTSPLPTDVLGGVLAPSAVSVTIAHNLGFDPLRPPGATSDGIIRLVVRSGTRVLARDSILPPFTAPVTRTLALSAGAVEGTIVTEATIESPAGGTVTINNNAGITLTVNAGTVSASEAHVRVQSRAISETVTVDMRNADEGLRDRVQRGTLVVDVVNPLAITGNFELRLHAAGVIDIRQPVQLGQGTTRVQIELDEAEVRVLFGRLVDLSLTGTATGTSGSVTLLPTSAITLRPRLDLILEFGS